MAVPPSVPPAITIPPVPVSEPFVSVPPPSVTRPELVWELPPRSSVELPPTVIGEAVGRRSLPPASTSVPPWRIVPPV